MKSLWILLIHCNFHIIPNTMIRFHNNTSFSRKKHREDFNWKHTIFSAKIHSKMNAKRFCAGATLNELFVLNLRLPQCDSGQMVILIIWLTVEFFHDLYAASPDHIDPQKIEKMASNTATFYRHKESTCWKRAMKRMKRE